MNERGSGWKHFVRSRSHVIHLSLTLATLLFMAFCAGPFFAYVESVTGSHFQDPLLAWLPVRNVSKPIFVLIYGAVVIGIVYCARSPYLLLTLANAYIALTLMRAVTLLLFPLEPDPQIIPLVDPVIDQFAYDNRVITKDLFFSGHVSVLALFAFVVHNRYLKYFFAMIACAVGGLLLVQHVHLTIDVIAAPVFAWASVLETRWLLPKT